MDRETAEGLLHDRHDDEWISVLAELMKSLHREEENELFPKVRRAHEAVLAGFDDELRKPVRAKSARPRRPAKEKEGTKKAAPTRRPGASA